jgi:Ni/Fe-hydrogenase subunit HybB-like protein
VKKTNRTPIRAAAYLAMAGIILNRIDYSIIAFKWYLPMSERYVPSWMEVTITAAIVLLMVWVFRWLVNRVPILKHSPQWAVEQDREMEAEEAGVPALAPQLGVTMADGGVPVEESKTTKRS